MPAGQPRLKRVRPVVKYTKTGGFNIAYQVVGNGPIDLLLLPGWITQLELQWDVRRWPVFSSASPASLG